MSNWRFLATGCKNLSWYLPSAAHRLLDSHFKKHNCFFKIDLFKAWNLIPMVADTFFKTTITTFFELHVSWCSSFGLQNAAHNFRRFSDYALGSEIITRKTMLAHQNINAPISIAVGASDSKSLGVLRQWINNTWQPLVFFSRWP